MRIKKGHDRRFRSGHPWVYSNELEGSPKGLVPGEITTLHDAAGRFLARGYANPHSLIAFRALSRAETEEDVGSPAFLERRLNLAWTLRRSLGLDGASFRLVFGEGDGLPGLIIDCFRVGADFKASQAIFVVQAHAAGADRWVSALLEVLPKLTRSFLGSIPVSVVVRNDVSIRKLEGVEIEEPRWLGQGARGVAPRETPAWVRSAIEGGDPLPLQCDWFSGQKTGLFLDQADNVASLVRTLLRSGLSREKRALRILDLCPYVGHWSAQLASALSSVGSSAQITLVDASADALEMARANARQAGAQSVESIHGDVLKDLTDLPSGSFDVVISDPPGFIKSRRDLPAGTHAYLQLHTQAARLVRLGGLWTASSCSGLLSEEDFVQTLARGASRSGAEVSWVGRGRQSADHPVSATFPEGRYLKTWLGFRVR